MVEGKLRLLETPRTLDTGPRGPESDLKAYSVMISSFMVTEDTIQVSKGGEQATVLPNKDAYEPQQ